MGNTEGDNDNKTAPGPNPTPASKWSLAGLDFVADGTKPETSEPRTTPVDASTSFLAGMDWQGLPPIGERSEPDPDEFKEDIDAGSDDRDDDDSVEDDCYDDADGNEGSDEATEPATTDPNGIENFNYVLLGAIRKDWPDEDSDHIEPACVDDACTARLFIAWLEDSIAVQVGEQLTEFRLDPETDGDGDIAREQLRLHVRSMLQENPQWGLQGQVLEEAVTMITATDLDDLLDGDEDERGWRCDSGQYEVSGWIGTWGELPESPEEADYAGGFYLSVVAFTNRDQVADATNLGVSRNARGDLEDLDLLAAVSELDHSYIVAARKSPKGIAGKNRATQSESTPPRSLPAVRTIESPQSLPTRHHPAEQSGTRPPARANSSNLIILVIVIGLVLAGLMFAYSRLIAQRVDSPQPPDTAQVLAPAPAPGGTDAALSEKVSSNPIATTVASPTAGFDCTNASTNVEAMICGSPQLSALDAMLGANYRNVQSADIGAAQQAELKATQRHWLTQRDACNDMHCLANAYMQRIDAICDYRLQSGQPSRCVRFQPDAREHAGNTPTAEGAASTPGSPAGSNTRHSNPGFDCGMHTSVVEQAICADEELGNLHRAMAEKYAALSYVGAGGDILRETHKFWMESRDRCSDKACLVEAYNNHIRDLDDFAASKR